MFREVTMIELKEGLRLWGKGLPKKRVAARSSHDLDCAAVVHVFVLLNVRHVPGDSEARGGNRALTGTVKFQSARSPSSGSIAAARRAGSKHAASAVPSARAIAATNAVASTDETPYSRLERARPIANAPVAPAMPPSTASHKP